MDDSFFSRHARAVDNRLAAIIDRAQALQGASPTARAQERLTEQPGADDGGESCIDIFAGARGAASTGRIAPSFAELATRFFRPRQPS